MMRGRFAWVLAAAAALLSCSSAHAQQPTFADEMAACSAASDIYGKPGTPHRLEITFEFPDAKGTKLTGISTELWEAEHRWRQETHIGALRWVDIDAPNGTWHLKDSGPEPIPLTLALASAKPCGEDPYVTKLRMHSPKTTKRDGREELCYVTAEGAEAFKQEFCFDPSNHTLLSTKQFGVDKKYRDYVPFEGKLVPTQAEITPTERSTIKVSLRYEALGAVGEDMFAAGPEFELKKRCAGTLDPPKVKFAPDPEYNEAARQHRVQGSAVLQVDVSTDGAPHNIVVLQHLPYGLDQQAVKAVQKWKFDPASCDGRPFPVTINVEVGFRL